MRLNYGKLIYSTLVLALIGLMSYSCKKDNNDDPAVLKDVDGNIYHTVNIGSQVWMVENFKATHFNDGTTEIQNVTDPIIWGGLNTPAYCWYNNDPNQKATYGALYNWYAITDSRFCPDGWHVPTMADWNELIKNLGADSTLAGGKLKESGTSHWLDPNSGASNSSGFTALPGGIHSTNGLFYWMGKCGWYWCTDETGLQSEFAWHIYMLNNETLFYRKEGSKSYGISVRLIADQH